MTKAELIDEISAKTGIPKKEVTASIESFMKIVKVSLSNNQNIYLRGFGSFVLKKRARKVARIISKNKAIIIPEHYIPSFKPAKSFSNKIKSSTKKSSGADEASAQ